MKFRLTIRELLLVQLSVGLLLLAGLMLSHRQETVGRIANWLYYSLLTRNGLVFDGCVDGKGDKP